MRFSALILTHNEEINIRDCLRSLRGVDRVVVIDSGSEDRTRAIVREFEGVELVERPFVSFSDQRNYGLDHCFAKGTWVLHLDADERLTRGLAREMRRLPDGGAAAYNLAPMTYLRGRAIPRAAGYPVYQTRLTRAGEFHFVEVGHGQKAPPGMGVLPRLKHPYEHHPFEKGLGEWLARHERYATLEARDSLEGAAYASFAEAVRDPIARRQWLKRAVRRLPFRPTLVYTYLMYIRGGVLDGPEGRDFCRMRALYETIVDLKVRELARQSSSSPLS